MFSFFDNICDFCGRSIRFCNLKFDKKANSEIAGVKMSGIGGKVLNIK